MSVSRATIKLCPEPPNTQWLSTVSSTGAHDSPRRPWECPWSHGGSEGTVMCLWSAALGWALSSIRAPAQTLGLS